MWHYAIKNFIIPIFALKFFFREIRLLFPKKLLNNACVPNWQRQCGAPRQCSSKKVLTIVLAHSEMLRRSKFLEPIHFYGDLVLQTTPPGQEVSVHGYCFSWKICFHCSGRSEKQKNFRNSNLKEARFEII